MDAFLAAWTAGVVPLRRRFGFEIAAWTVPGEPVLAWVITYRGAGSFDDAERAYYDSPERKALDPDPGQWVIDKDDRWLDPLDIGE